MQTAPSIERPVIWRPIEGSSQELALDARAQHILYFGTRGPGKSDTQLMRFRRRVGMGYGPFWRGIIFDREYKHLDDLVTKSKRWFNRFNDGAHWHGATNEYKWTWPTGEELLFRVIKDKDDYENYHGHEYPFIGWNELTKYPDSVCYDMMMSCNRSSFTPEKDAPIINGKRVDVPPIPLEVFSTTNSYGVGHGWVKRRFIDPAPYGKVVRTTISVFNPATQHHQDIERTQVAIFGTYRENKYLDPIYIAGLMEMCKSNENLRKAWLEGSWDIVAGGAFDDLWRSDTHIIPRFQIPETFYLDRTFDWGSSRPFSIGWWAEATGEEINMPDGSVWAPVRGSLIQIAEWYGAGPGNIGLNKGIKMGSGKVAEGIKLREQQLLIDEWILKQPQAGPADNEIRTKRDSDDEMTIEERMHEKGVRWEESNKRPGSRRNGFELAREMLENATTGEGPGLYFMENCRATIALLPAMPRDEDLLDDVDTEAEDHVWDMIRYRVLKGARRSATDFNINWVN